MTVTAIRQTSADRLTLVLDEAEEIKTTLGVITEHRLYSGAQLDDKSAEAFRRDSARALARERAILLTSRRMYSRKELRDRLILKGEDADTAEYCVDWLERCGFLDDAAYAAAIVRHYAAKNMGIGRIRMELSRRGISRELWDEALAAMPDTGGALERYIELHLSDPLDSSAVRKVSAALFRRGFSWDEIRAAIDRYTVDYEEDK